MSMPNLVTGDVSNSKWSPPPRFSSASVNNVLRWWVETCREAGAPTKIDPNSQRRQAELLIADLGYVETLRTLAWMSTPQSKYFQYGYGLKVVKKANEELKSGVIKDHGGFIGPVGLKNLGE